jgi:hypothetical protein
MGLACSRCSRTFDADAGYLDLTLTSGVQQLVYQKKEWGGVEIFRWAPAGSLAGWPGFLAGSPVGWLAARPPADPSRASPPGLSRRQGGSPRRPSNPTAHPLPTPAPWRRNPLVSFVYERGWRQGFAWAGFPGVEREFELAMAYLAPARGSVLLDMSCGSGLFTRKFAASGAFSGVIAADFSESMLQQTRAFLDEDRGLQGGCAGGWAGGEGRLGVGMAGAQGRTGCRGAAVASAWPGSCSWWRWAHA